MNQNRREFLKISGSGMLMIGAAPLLNACGGVVRSDLSVNGKDKPAVPGLDPVSADILYHASLAPSGHNTQPWTVTIVEPNRWIIGSAMERRLPAVDPENREMLLSIGAFLENLIIAARSHGYDVEYRVIAATPKDAHILEVILKAAAPVVFPLEKIRTRRTVRNGLLTGEINATDLNAMSQPFGDRLIYFPRTSKEGIYLREATIEANRIQAYREHAQEELADWIRWKDEDARRHRNGLTPEGMEITGIAGWYARHFMDRSDVFKKSFREQTMKIVRKRVENCGGWLVITSGDSRVASLVETGRLFERLLLTVREKMIAVHPMTQMLEESPIKEEVAKGLGLSGYVQFILRTGYLKFYPDPVSLRMPLSRFVNLKS